MGVSGMGLRIPVSSCFLQSADSQVQFGRVEWRRYTLDHPHLFRVLSMSRLSRLLLSLMVLSGLVACGNKGDLVKPSAPAEMGKSAPLGG